MIPTNYEGGPKEIYAFIKKIEQEVPLLHAKQISNPWQLQGIDGKQIWNKFEWN